MRCCPVALLAEGVDRNLRGPRPCRSRPAVALLAEGVDRNIIEHSKSDLKSVALLAEGVDRNQLSYCRTMAAFVALLAEGVDRNPVKKKERQNDAWRRPPRGGRG